MLKKILLTLAALLVILVLIGSFLTTHYEVSRSVLIQAPTEKIFSLISDLKQWPAWEPFSSRNKNMQTVLGEKTSGVDAAQSWAGEGDQGRLTFTECDPKTGITFDLVFTNGGRDSLARSWMHMNPRPDGAVEVVWAIDGEINMPVIGGYAASFSDRMMGPMFEEGLAKLKAKAEEK